MDIILGAENESKYRQNGSEIYANEVNVDVLVYGKENRGGVGHTHNV